MVPEEVSLTSENRAAKRREFNAHVKKQMADLEALQERMAAEKENDERELRRELRNKPISEGGLLFKAAPIQEKDLYKTTIQEKAPLTEPHSPNLQCNPRPRQSVCQVGSSTTGGMGGSRSASNSRGLSQAMR